MRKVSFYIIGIAIAGAAVTGVWAYERYFKPAEQPFLYFTVSRGDIQESLKVRGEVVAQKQFELEFPFQGTVAAVYVKDGQPVSAGERLMKLDTASLAIQASQESAVVAQRKADYEKLVAGATAEDISVSEAALSSARVALEDASANLAGKIRNAYTVADDSVRSKTDRMFDNPRTANPSLIQAISASSAARSELDAERVAIETMLASWSASLNAPSGDLSVDVQSAARDAASVSAYLDTLSQVVSGLTPNVSLSQAAIDSYDADVSTARTNMNAATASLGDANEKYQLAEAAVTLAEKQLELKRAPARSEDIAAAAARVQEAEDQLAAIDERIAESTLVAPSAGKVSRLHEKVGEIFHPGASAVSMVTAGYKLQADVSELDIAKVDEVGGNVVRIALDAFQGRQFVGRVTSVDAQEVVKSEDKYYRVNIVFDADGASVRSGMSADATILSSLRTGVLRLPEIAVYADSSGKYVEALPPGVTKAAGRGSLTRIDVKTGVSDGENVEILGGLQDGQTVVVAAE